MCKDFALVAWFVKSKTDLASGREVHACGDAFWSVGIPWTYSSLLLFCRAQSQGCRYRWSRDLCYYAEHSHWERVPSVVVFACLPFSIMTVRLPLRCDWEVWNRPPRKHKRLFSRKDQDSRGRVNLSRIFCWHSKHHGEMWIQREKEEFLNVGFFSP